MNLPLDNVIEWPYRPCVRQSRRAQDKGNTMILDTTHTTSHCALIGALGSEYWQLAVSDRALVRADYEDAYAEDATSAKGYQARIGKGNLASYVRCLRVNARRCANCGAVSSTPDR